MKWKGRKRSTNVEDRRGKSKFAIAGGGFGIVIILLVALLGGNPANIVNNLGSTDHASLYEETAEEKELIEFVSVVLADTESVWTKLFNDQGMDYEEPTLVLFSENVQSACGIAGSAVGPFYCPADYKLYIDLSFFQELRGRYEAPGDFAMAYVIAHEVGHHVQTLLGITEEVNSFRSKVSESEFNEYSVKLELQADYFSGVWAHYAKELNLLDKGDLEEALNAAGAVGDDRLQEAVQGYSVPESFTHGTSEQRVNWFRRGYESGSINDGDTFNTPNL